MVSGNFEDAFLIRGNSDITIGLQMRNELQTYNSNLIRISISKCQCSFFSRDIMLLGDVKNIKKLEFTLPDYITCIKTNQLFARIFCATKDNNVYVIDLNERPL